MKKITIITAAGLLLASCGSKPTDNDQASLAEASRQELTEALSERDSLIALMSDISQGMEQIKHIENIMVISGVQTDENPAQRSQLKNDLAVLQTTLQQRREQLEELESRLQGSKLSNQKLQSTIAELKKQIETQTSEIESLRLQLASANDRIGVLDQQVDSLNTTVRNVSSQRDSVQTVSTNLENELNICFYVAATKAALKQHHIIESGFLKKTKLMKGDFDKGFFVISDKRTLTRIPLESKKAKILTTHPAGTYVVTETENGKVLEITNPGKFWDTSNYLVIQID